MSAMKEVSEEIRKALDDLPVHSQQLFHMFRKHKAKNARNSADFNDADRSALQMAESVGWKGDGPLPKDIVDTPKGQRPKPETYLDEDYIKEHLARFDGGATRFYRADSLDEYGPGNKGTTFIVPTSEVQDIIDKAKTPEELGEMLGLGKDFFVGGDVVRADFTGDELKSLKLDMASGNEGYGNGGANEHWMPGGLLPDGNHEAVIQINDKAEGGGFKPFTFAPKG